MGIYKEGESQKLAEFIFKNVKKFSKPILGDFLGDIDEFYASVLRDFTFLFNFERENMANAMRRYFSYFDAPGEAQKIERISYVFADKYIVDNPDVVDSESGGVFAFLMVMLHTNLYNPNVDAAQKFSLDAFLNMGKAIKTKNNESLSVEWMTEIYHNIKETPLALHVLDARKEFLDTAVNTNMKKKEQLYLDETKRIATTCLQMMGTVE